MVAIWITLLIITTVGPPLHAAPLKRRCAGDLVRPRRRSARRGRGSRPLSADRALSCRHSCSTARAAREPARVRPGHEHGRRPHQPSEREARTDTPTHPPSPRRAAPQPRASPSEGRPAATPHRDRRTRRGSKLPAGPPRRSAPHHQPPIGAEWPCDLPAVNSRIYFIFLEKNHLLLVNLKVANNRENFEHNLA